MPHLSCQTSLELMESEIMDQLREREREQQARVQALLQRLSPPKQPAFSHAVSFASPESDAAGPIALELTAADQRAALAEARNVRLVVRDVQNAAVRAELCDVGSQRGVQRGQRERSAGRRERERNDPQRWQASAERAIT